MFGHLSPCSRRPPARSRDPRVAAPALSVKTLPVNGRVNFYPAGRRPTHALTILFVARLCVCAFVGRDGCRVPDAQKRKKLVLSARGMCSKLVPTSANKYSAAPARRIYLLEQSLPLWGEPECEPGPPSMTKAIESLAKRLPKDPETDCIFVTAPLSRSARLRPLPPCSTRRRQGCRRSPSGFRSCKHRSTAGKEAASA